MACVPGMPCYEPIVKIVYPPGCCPVPYEIINSSRVNYDGPNLACTGIQSNDCLNTALQKIDEKICSDQFVAQIIQTIENNSILKAYFCQLVSGCTPTTTTTTTIPFNCVNGEYGPYPFNYELVDDTPGGLTIDFTGENVPTVCGYYTTYLSNPSRYYLNANLYNYASLNVGATVYIFEDCLNTIADGNYLVIISPGVSKVVTTIGGVISLITDC